MVQDGERCIFNVRGAPPHRLPLSDLTSFGERFALMNWRILQADPIEKTRFQYWPHWDPAETLSIWRTVKLTRGLLQHSKSSVRVQACRELIAIGFGQDECWEQLTEEERNELSKLDPHCCTAARIAAVRALNQQRGTDRLWRQATRREDRQLLTAMSIRHLRTEFCRFYKETDPGDQDNGCPADQLPPATHVTDDGDVPLAGTWPIKPKSANPDALKTR